VIDTSILAKSNIGRREYIVAFKAVRPMWAEAPNQVAATVPPKIAFVVAIAGDNFSLRGGYALLPPSQFIRLTREFRSLI
jgi:hypothetical protein